MKNQHTLWYRQPADGWDQALPLGNGRMGAIIFGSVSEERLQLNEETLWAGEPIDVFPEDSAPRVVDLEHLALVVFVEDLVDDLEDDRPLEVLDRLAAHGQGLVVILVDLVADFVLGVSVVL